MSDIQKKKIYKPFPISGFPEWLPEVRRIEQQWFDIIRATFERYGFCSIETPSVETLDALSAKSEEDGADVDKEVYVIERLHKEDGDKEARLALHFDQTVPFARYTAQHFNDLIFPFKRYQMQRVWRGERPQKGRFREFYQCDIDVINVDHIPLHFDAEMPAVIWEVFEQLPGVDVSEIQIRISNRKILMGFLDSLILPTSEGIERPLSNLEKIETIRCIDKLEKLGKRETYNQIMFTTMMGVAQLTEPFLDLCTQKFTNSDDLIDAIQMNKHIDTSHPMIREGIEELSFVMNHLTHLPEGAVVADLGIVRGLDYYTGTVYETVFKDNPTYGSICSGGRYDDLAGNYINKSLPGVGISIGFSRLFDYLREAGKLPLDGRISPADVMVVLPSEEQRATANQTAQALRARGINVEVFHSPSKIKRQMAYAEKKGIPYVWFPPFDAEGAHEVKDMKTGEQNSADPASWEIPA